MELELSERDVAMLDGKEGEARQIAMRVIVRMAKLSGATHLIDICRAHIDACGYPGQGAITFAETLAKKGGTVKVKTTMNAVAQALETRRLVGAFVQMGATPTLTCAPYQLPDPPNFGEHIAWGESNAVVFANSVLGARTNRYGDGMEVCAALAGRVPLSGYHLDENRRGSVLVQLPKLKIDSSFYPVLGYLIGGRVPRGVPVIEGISSLPSVDELKSFAAALASSGAIALFHMIGVTPEASTKEAVLPTPPDFVWNVTTEEIHRAYLELASDYVGPVDAVVCGSPHLSLSELKTIAMYIKGRRRHTNIEVIITTDRHTYGEAQKLGIIEEIQRFGATCLTDTCPCFLDVPTIPESANVILTPSAKYAHYGPGLLQRKVCLASIKDCLDAAISGQFSPSVPPWLQETV